jgi:hypothetical protein
MLFTFPEKIDKSVFINCAPNQLKIIDKRTGFEKNINNLLVA